MEKFMYLFRGGDSSATDSKNMQAWMTWMDGLQKQGRLLGGDPLQASGKQVTGNKMVITDGPFVEAKESVGGYLIVSAKDINEALELSRECPIFTENGRLEVRPIHKM